MRHGLLTLVFAASFTALISGQDIAWAGKKQEAIAGKVAALFTPFESYIAKVTKDRVYLTTPRLAPIIPGALGEIVDRSQNRIAVIRIVKTGDKFAVAEILSRNGRIDPKNHIARGINLPARILWIGHVPKDEDAGRFISEIEEAARGMGVLDLVVADVAYYLLERNPDASPETLSKLEIAKTAKATGADFTVLISLGDSHDGAKPVRIKILDNRGAQLLAMTDSWKPAASIPAPESVASAKSGAPFITGGLTKRDGVPADGAVAPKENVPAPLTAPRATKEPAKPLDFQWDKHRFKGAVLSAAYVYTGGVVARDLALLFKRGIRVMRLENGALTPKWESGSFRGLNLISLAAYDSNGDGREEIFVNAHDGRKLSSFILDTKGGGEYKVMADKIPYLFSKTSLGTMLAQKQASVDTALLEMAVSVVSREGDDIKLTPYFTLGGSQPTFGLNSIDLEGDGVMELAGITEEGELRVFTGAGKLLWKKSGFGGTERVVETIKGVYDNIGFQAHPKIISIARPGGDYIALGGSEKAKGSIFSIGGSAGSVRVIRLNGDSYDEIFDKEFKTGFISDLIDLSGGQMGRRDTYGFIHVIPGMFKTNSTVFLPKE